MLNHGLYFSSAVALADKDVHPLLLTSAGQLRVSSEGAVASGGADTGSPVKVAGVYNSTLPTFATGQRGDLQVGTRGSLNTTNYFQNSATAYLGTADNGDAAAVSATADKLAVLARPTRFNGTSWDRERKANATARLISAAATTNATSVKASAGDLFKVRGFNNKASAVFLKLYNKASAPTVGTDTPVLTFRLAPSADFAIDLDGFYCSAGIAYAITGAAADADTTALAAGDVQAMNLTYA
jgi:hypothetical protein